MDSQCKYGIVASGQADLYLRLPVKEEYVENIWDHAAGDLIVREAGGCVTDMLGRPLDFSTGGPKLINNRGVIASCNPTIHAAVLSAIQTMPHKL
jgi:3'-phosphoadenosine 5'-phosphosulfate (PAPS) 3'-phosphatase